MLVRMHRGRWVSVAVMAAAAAGLLLAPSCGNDEEETKTPGYLEVLADAKIKADAVACQVRLRALGQALASYALSNEGRFPPSLAALAESGMAPGMPFRCPVPSGQPYAYVPGQNQGMPRDNIIVYEEKAVHAGRCNVARLDGSVASLTKAELDAAKDRTLGRIKSGPR